ncbi:MAG: [FeFe] hydrogenase H-cluster radical SAM maturase HydG, partial [Thermodesulfobacteriota bacterium]
MNDIIDFSLIDSLVAASNKVASKEDISAVLDRAFSLKGLSLKEAALLLSVKDPALIKDICEAAFKVKRRVYGDRIVLFAPLYLTNHCT